MRNLSFLFLPLLFGILLTFPACEEDDMTDPGTDPTTTDYFLGWTGEDNIGDIPTTTNFGFGGTNDLPSSVDLIPKFPPIGDQGQYGTCVSWAVGYNIKTALAGMTRGLSASALSSPSNQYSPKYLFTAIPDSDKGADCGGTNFSSALDVLQNRGIATMQTVPYNDLGNCSQSGLQSNWDNEASGNKIKYWRKIDASVSSIKQNLANNIPVILGAKLADNFMTWNSSAVLSSNTTYNNVGQHAYHAMVIAGYDDSKGPNGAFRVINSWGNGWGDRGYFWVDYNFLINEFCTSYSGDKPLFLAADEEGSVNPPDDPDPVASGVDLVPWVFSDYSTYWTNFDPYEREIDFNIYNIGNQSAEPSANWSIYYIYYNAYDANDYGVLFYDEFNTSTNPGTFNCPTSYNCIFNYSIPSGADFSSMVWGWESVTRTYYMPDITGSYYLVLIADAGDVFQEQDELNNLFYTTIYPKWFEGGYSDRPAEAGSDAELQFENPVSFDLGKLKTSPFQTAVRNDNRNAYTPEEILDFVQRKLNTGELREKVVEQIQGKGGY